jgi:hypothetical protein
MRTTLQAATRPCRLCGQALDGAILDLGALPACNHFTDTRIDLPIHALSIACCRGCGLIQLLEPAPIEAVMPQVPWIRYNEPDVHLDDLVGRLLARPTDVPTSAIGVGPFERPLLDRLAKRGLATKSIDLPTQVAAAAEGYPYLESWQALLQAEILVMAARDFGNADIVSCRYLLEHCHAPLAGLEALAQLLSADGYLVVEVPDCSKFLSACDYCFLWEEHVSYFVEATFGTMVEAAGLEIIELLRYRGRLEDVLIGVLRHRRAAATRAAPRGVAEAVDTFTRYRDAFPTVCGVARRRIAALAGPTHEGVALFGAGHQAVMFVNAFGLGSNIAAVVDDDANKHGWFAPGIDVPIICSPELMDRQQLRACLLAVSPRAETTVREKLAPLAARGVSLHTIYAGLSGSILEGWS